MDVIWLQKIGGGGPQPISMAVMFPFVCSVLSPHNSCMLEGKENVNQGSRNAPAGHPTCLLLWLEGRCCSTLWFLFKADNRKFMVPIVCVLYEMHVFRGVCNSWRAKVGIKRDDGETQLVFFLHCTTNVQDFSPENIAHLVCPHAAVVLYKSHCAFGTFCYYLSWIWSTVLIWCCQKWQLYCKQSLIWWKISVNAIPDS